MKKIKQEYIFKSTSFAKEQARDKPAARQILN